MTVKNKNLVSAREFRRNLDKYLTAAQDGEGPVAVLNGATVMGYLIGPEEYELVRGKAIRKLLKERMKGPTISHEQVRNDIQKIVQGRSRTK